LRLAKTAIEETMARTLDEYAEKSTQRETSQAPLPKQQKQAIVASVVRKPSIKHAHKNGNEL
jgi:hypothetical protein